MPKQRGIAAREHPLRWTSVLQIVISTSAKARRIGRPTTQWNSTTTTSRTSALTSTSVASQSRSSFAARRRQLKPFRSTLAQGFLSKPSKEPIREENQNSSTSPLLEARHRRTPRRPVLARRRQPKPFSKLTCTRIPLETLEGTSRRRTTSSSTSPLLEAQKPSNSRHDIVQHCSGT